MPILTGGQLTGLNINNLRTGGGNFQRDDLRSRWQVQIGTRLRF